MYTQTVSFLGKLDSWKGKNLLGTEELYSGQVKDSTAFMILSSCTSNLEEFLCKPLGIRG